MSVASSRSPRPWLKPLAIGSAVVLAGLAGVVVWAGAAGAVPECADASAKETLHKAFDASPSAQLLRLTAVSSDFHAQVQWDKANRTRQCRAVLTLNNAQRNSVAYSMQGRDDGSFVLMFTLD